MIRILQIFSALALICASIIFKLCANLWLHDAHTEQNPGISIVEKFKQGDGGQKDSKKTLSPLVKQAKTFALYLNPPELPKSKVASSLEIIEEKKQPEIRPAISTPKFTLIATSYYRTKPEDSMALVSEPGSGFRWVKRGSHLGHFVVEKVEPGILVFQDGEDLLEMLVTVKGCDNIVRAYHRTTSLAKSSITNEQNTPAITASDKLDPTGLEAQPVAFPMASEQTVSNTQLGASNK